MISAHLTNKNYNVNDAQIWTNQICDDVCLIISRSSRILPLSTATSSSLPIASSCRRLIADSTSQDPASGIMRSMAPSLSSGMPLHSSALSTSSDAHYDPIPLIHTLPLPHPNPRNTIVTQLQSSNTHLPTRSPTHWTMYHLVVSGLGRAKVTVRYCYSHDLRMQGGI